MQTSVYCDIIFTNSEKKKNTKTVKESEQFQKIAFLIDHLNFSLVLRGHLVVFAVFQACKHFSVQTVQEVETECRKLKLNCIYIINLY